MYFLLDTIKTIEDLRSQLGNIKGGTMCNKCNTMLKTQITQIDGKSRI